MFPYSVILDNSWSMPVYQIVLGAVLGLVCAAPILIAVVVYNYNRLVYWWEDLFGINYTSSSTYEMRDAATNKPIKPVTTSKAKPIWGKTTDKWGLYADDKQAPPRATFFERVEGQERIDLGPWEEVYLNARELAAWNSKKLKDPSLVADITAKTPDMDETKSFQEQYDYNAGYRG